MAIQKLRNVNNIKALPFDVSGVISNQQAFFFSGTVILLALDLYKLESNLKNETDNYNSDKVIRSYDDITKWFNNLSRDNGQDDTRMSIVFLLATKVRQLECQINMLSEKRKKRCSDEKTEDFVDYKVNKLAKGEKDRYPDFFNHSHAGTLTSQEATTTLNFSS